MIAVLLLDGKKEYIFTHPFPHRQYMTQGQFLSGVQGCAMRRLSERDSELNQKQTTYGTGREHPIFSIPSFD